MDYSKLIKANLKIIGSPFTIKDNNRVISSYAVLEQTQRSNRIRFDKISSQTGTYFRNYYIYIGPYDVDIKSLSDDAELYLGNEKYIFVQKEAQYLGGAVQYYRGIVKRSEGDENVFA